MGNKIFLSAIFFFIVVFLLAMYWFFPFGEVSFETRVEHSNFNLNASNSGEMQFYENLRYPSSKISYKIEDCPLNKKGDMEEAFLLLEEKTILDFYPVNSNPEISVFCDSHNRIEGGMFIAGEGGPSNITQTDNFNVIKNGMILLIRPSECENPNVALHELIHALGFTHSENPNNIMYNISNCKQTLGEDIPQMINLLYGYPSQPDLSFENSSASMKGKYLDVTISVRNNGLIDSPPAKIIVYADESIVQETTLDSLEVGSGKIITLTNIWVKQISVSKIKFVINASFEELDKSDNTLVLEIKK